MSQIKEWDAFTYFFTKKWFKKYGEVRKNKAKCRIVCIVWLS